MVATMEVLAGICSGCWKRVWCGKDHCEGAKMLLKNVPVKRDPWDDDDDEIAPPRTGPVQRRKEPVKMVERKVEKVREAPVAVGVEKNIVGSAKDDRAKRKSPVSMRFPDEVLDHFKAEGSGWQGRIMAVLLDYVRKAGP